MWWYRKSLFDDAGAKVPTTWDELMTAGEALKKKGYFGFGDGAGAGNNIGAHTMVFMMINNGGGMFTPDGKLDVLNERNVEAIDFIIQLVKAGISRPRVGQLHHRQPPGPVEEQEVRVRHLHRGPRHQHRRHEWGHCRWSARWPVRTATRPVCPSATTS